jgi:aspartyl-tRNA(Asn)/glutamyl-tRNA(Gln) amidotransferase subunit C
MASITQEDVRKLSRIACIEIEEHEIKQLTQELEAVLNYASSLKVVAENSAVTIPEESNPFFTVNRTREDEPVPYDTEILLKEAPAREDNFFVVPVIVKQE